MSCKLWIAAAALALPTVANPAPIFSNIVDTQNELSYDISGTVTDATQLAAAVSHSFDATFPWAHGAISVTMTQIVWFLDVTETHVAGSAPLTVASGIQPYGA